MTSTIAALSRLPPGAERELSYTEDTRGLAPIPPWERDLPTAVAEPFFKVSDGPICLEGPAFDRDGNLLFLDVYNGKVFRLSQGNRLETVFADAALTPAGIAIHKDGRIFLACVGPANAAGRFTAGSVVALDPDSGNRQVIVPPEAGYVLDDLVFDGAGGFYMSDFKGSSTQADGGIHYVTPGGDCIIPVLPNMHAANGVALSPDGTVLWATEFGTCRLHRADLSGAATVARFGSSVPYHFVGRAPDSMRTDSAGNVYVAMYHQARIMVFSSTGIPIGQILLPGRAGNRFLKSTSLALVPGSRDLVIVARDELGDGGAVIFAARGLAEGFPLFSHQ